MNATQLKNSILQEAIEGRLVPQDPNDEPASVLLDKIRKEKAKLVKEGKLKKKDLEETSISEDEIPFEIPESWEWVRFGTITINRDRERIPLSVDERSKLEKKYDYYGASGVIDKVDRFLFNKPLLLIGEDGANLINRSTPIAFIARGEYWVNNHAHVLDYINEDLMQFVCWYINAISLVNYVTGTAQPKMNQEKMNSILVALPPLTEQKRIVAKIEELLPKVEEYGKAQEALDKLNEGLPERLKKSILQEAIEGRLVPQDPNDEPASVLLDKIRKEKARLVKEGKLKKKDLEETSIEEDEKRFSIPKGWERSKLSFITSLLDGEKSDGDYVCLDAKYLRGKSPGDFLSKGKFVKKGDNIILVDGENSGEVFTVPCDGYMGSTFKQLWVSKSMYLPYVLHFIRFYKDILRNSKKGAAIPHLNKEIFNNLVVGIPPLAEQYRIVAKIEQLMKEIDKLKV